jgi:hypothetical protein
VNTIKAPEPGIRVIDWQKLLTVALDHPVQTSLFVITFAFLLLVEPPIPLSFLLLSTLVYFIFAFGSQSSRVEGKLDNVSALPGEPTAPQAPVVAENVAAPSATSQETTRSPARRSTRRASEPKRPQANPQRNRQRTSRNPK